MHATRITCNLQSDDCIVDILSDMSPAPDNGDPIVMVDCGCLYLLPICATGVYPSGTFLFRSIVSDVIVEIAAITLTSTYQDFHQKIKHILAEKLMR